MPAPARTPHPHRPIYLLADSQLLFWKPDGKAPFLRRALPQLAGAASKAAYLGASNGDRAEFYALFVAAMAAIGIHACRHIHAALPRPEAAFLAEADLILLAGGDPGLGLRTLQHNGAAELIIERYRAGSLLMGVSAGAMQLGRSVIAARDSDYELLPALALVPFIIDAHQESSGWRSLGRAVRDLDGAISGVGIPTGGGALFHTDGTLEPVRAAVHELTFTNGTLQRRARHAER